MTSNVPGRRIALISVYHKGGIVDLAKALIELGFDLLASGGTAKHLASAGLPVRDVAELVGGGPILGHRVVTLSREVHAGLLANDTPEDRAELAKLGIPFIDLACVDLYPLEEEIARAGSTPESVIEKTDIGGPTMLSSAAKGRRIVIADPEDRGAVIAWLHEGEPDSEVFRRRLQAKADGIVANYRLASARFHSNGAIDGMIGTKVTNCKYGENPYQTPAALYATNGSDPLAIHRFNEIEGTAPSFVNLTDLDRMLQTMTHIAAGFDANFGFVPKIAIGVKHGNPCGAAVGTDELEVIERMVEGDPRALMGGFVMTNFQLTEQHAERLRTHLIAAGSRRILDGVVAPDVSDGAVEALSRKGNKCRIIVNSRLMYLGLQSLDQKPLIRPVWGGFLSQPNYTFVFRFDDSALERLPNGVVVQNSARRDIVLAWAIAATSTSNTVTLVKDGKLIGNGVGQQDRVGACELALKRARDAGHNTHGAIAASDSFFPFPDGPKVLADMGISLIQATSGSIKDGEVKEFCAERGVALYLIPDAIGRGFFNH